jgi:cobalt-zinc-cadmium efflux system outer membrane protein
MGRILVAVLWAVALSPAAQAGEVSLAPSGPALADDPTLKAFVKESLERRPELAQARAQIRAESERAPQVTALPDPTLSLGIQNDGFSGIQVGKMETSFLAVTASQTFPLAGKRGLRGEVAHLGERSVESDLQRALLTAEADVERAYLDLLLVRDQLALLAKLETLWVQSEGLARARYEAGEGTQSDLLRAQLERARLRQRRWSLESDERRRLAALNRLRVHPLDEPVLVTRSLVDLPDPLQPDLKQAAVQAEADSPELKKAMLSDQQAHQRVDLAKRERWPDLTLMAGLMPRWGNFPMMWQAAVSFNVPIWSAQKQGRAVAESQARQDAAASGAETIRQVLRERIVERLAALRALVESNRIYRDGLLVQSEATANSTLLQYQVGRVTFASVLEALAGYLNDRGGFLESIAAAQRIAIAQQELSLDAVASGGAGLGGGSMPGSGGQATSGPGAASVAAQGGDVGGASTMNRM